MGLRNYNFFNQLSFAFLLLTLFIVPFFFVPYSSLSLDANKGFVIFIGISLATIFWLVASLFGGKLKVPHDRLIILGAIIPLIFLISSYFSPFFYISLLGNGFEIGTVMSMLILYLIFVLSAVHFQTEKRFWYFGLILFSSLSLTLIFQIINLIVGIENIFPNLLKGIQANNLVGNWNDFALFAGLAVLFSLCTIELLKIKKIYLILIYFLLIISLFFLAIIHVPSLWLLVGLLALIILVYSLTINKSSANKFELGNKFKFPYTSSLVIFLAIIFIVGGIRLNELVANKINIINYDIRPSITATNHIALNALNKNMFLGTGPNTFTIDWALWRSPDINQTIFWNVDFVSGYSLFLTFLVSVGILGFLVLLLFIIVYLIRSMQSIKIAFEDKISKYFIMMFLLISVYGWLVFIFYNPNYVLLALTFSTSGLLLGYLVNQNAIKVKTFLFVNNTLNNIFMTLILNILIFIFLFIIYSFTLRYVSIIYYTRSLNFDGSNPESLEYSQKMLSKAIVLNKSDIYYRALSQIYINQLNFLLSNYNLSDQVINKNMQVLIDQAEASAIDAVNQNRSYYLNYVNLGNIYSSLVPLSVKDSYNGALLAYNTANKLAPSNPQILFLRARLEEQNNNFDLAKEYLRQALDLKKDYLEASLFLDSLNKQVE